MNGSDGLTYQMFETYYRRAAEAEQSGKPSEAKQLYMLAGESLLKTAKTTSGDTRLKLIQRADKLFKIADGIALGQSGAAPAAGSAEKGAVRASEKRSEDDTETIWQSAGKPNVRFDDIAGLNHVKESIRRRVVLPRLHPDIYKTFKRNVSGGILLYGPPGTGKTMIAKALACEVDAEFFSIRCSDIVAKYFGEAERNVKRLFETAHAAKSAVLFFDEFEALASRRGSDSPVMNRLVPELLSQMDGFSISDSNSLLFLAATNRPFDIDSAFLRPPRLTEKIHVGLPDYEARLFLARRALKDIPRDANVSPELIAQLTDGYNAADVVAFCEAVKDEPIDRTIVTGAISNVTLADVNNTARRVPSSVQKADLELIRDWEKSQGIITA